MVTEGRVARVEHPRPSSCAAIGHARFAVDEHPPEGRSAGTPRGVKRLPAWYGRDQIWSLRHKLWAPPAALAMMLSKDKGISMRVMCVGGRVASALRPKLLLSSMLAMCACAALWMTAAEARNVSQRLAPEEPSGIALIDGRLYVADQARNQLLERTQSGAWQVVAGAARRGARECDGQALHAGLSDPTALAAAQGGSLYIVASEGRQVCMLRRGTLSVFAGNGREVGGVPTVGKLAANVPMAPTDIVAGPGRTMYIAEGHDVVQVAGSGTIRAVVDLALARSSGRGVTNCYPSGLAVSASGTMFLACGNSNDLLERLPSGRYAILEKYQRFDGPTVVDVRGAVMYTGDQGIFRVQGTKMTVVLSTRAVDRQLGNRQHFRFVPFAFAISGAGDLFADADSENGFSDVASVIEIKPSGRVVLLSQWTPPGCPSHCERMFQTRLR